MSTPTAANATSAASLDAKVQVLFARLLLAQTGGDLDAVLEMVNAFKSLHEDDEADQADEGDDDNPAAPPAQPQLFTSPAGTRHSLLQLHGSHSSTCGYCHASTQGRAAYGLTAKALTCVDYQALIDAGWRRSGDYCYRPSNESACCPNWTIRLRVAEFVKSKAHRKVERRMTDWLDRRGEEEGTGGGVGGGEGEGEGREEKMEDVEQKEGEDANIAMLRRALWASVASLQNDGKLQTRLTETILSPQLRVYLQPQRKARSKAASSIASATTIATPATPSESLASYSTNLAFLLASACKEIHVAMQPLSAAELVAQQLNSSGVQCTVTAPGYLNFALPAIATRPSARRKSSVSTPHRPAVASAAPALPPRELTVTQVPATYTQEAFEVFQKYQREVHSEGSTPSRYKSFLCTSPLVSDHPEYGAFHHHYRVDGKLIAVGVVDILPLCLSSVYLFYDPAYQHLSLGIYTALAEIDWVRRFQLGHPRCEYYYLGYTIVTCAKMRYKATFRPPQLLCDVRHTWHHMDECMRWLVHSRYAVFSDVLPQWTGPADAAARTAREREHEDQAQQPQAGVTPQSYSVSERTREEVKARLARLERDVLPRVPLVYQGKMVQYERLKARMPAALCRLATEYVGLVGEELALRMAVQVR